MVVVANYFFDSIPHDAFYIADSSLYESLVTLASPEEETDLSDPELLNRVKIGYTRRRADSDYYDDPDCNLVLQEYTDRLNETALMFPWASLRVIRYFLDLSGDRLLVLSGDKGYSSEESLAARREPDLTVHGSFSLMVNYSCD